MAADQFAECQKTIASLGQQLKSLASLEDFLMDSEKQLELTGEDIQGYQSGVEPHNLRSSNLNLPKRDSAVLEAANNWSYSSKMKSERRSSLSRDPAIDTEKSQNGFGKLFHRSKN